jgi:hypothetical protein
MAVPRSSIQAGQCYLTVNGQVARVVKLLPYGGVHYQFRECCPRQSLWLALRQHDG